MKSNLLKTGLLACLILLGLSYEEASAEMSWPAKCTSFGEVKPNQNPSTQHLNCLLTEAALEANIPPEVVKAVAEQESGWRQFKDGKPFISTDKGIGIMQITNNKNYVLEKLEADIYYNIQAGVEILNSMYQRNDLPKINGMGREVIENWYFPVMAYNGIKPINSPLVQKDGTKNLSAYQEKIFTLIDKDSFLKGTRLGRFPFNRTHFNYQTDSGDNIKFLQMKYTLTDQMHTSTHLFKKGDRVAVTVDGATLRYQPSTSSTSKSLKKLVKNTSLIINGEFKYDQSLYSANKFVWIPVKTSDLKLAGYISSAYIIKQLNAPIVGPVDDNDLTISGKTVGNVRIQIMNGTKLVGSSISNSTGNFKAKILAQKAGTQLAIAYKDKLNALSNSKKVVVIDKTAPKMPSVNKVSNKALSVTGKTEAYAKVTVAIAKKTYSKLADKHGNYRVTIPVQNTGTKLKITSKDKAGHVSATRSMGVIRVAPNQPVVNKVKYSSSTVTGKTEKYAKVTIKIGTKKYTAKANSKSLYKVKIPKQRAGKKLYVYAKDAKGKVSATRTVTVSK